MKKFSTKTLSLLGIMTALSVAIQFISGFLAMSLSAIPGASNFIIGMMSTIVLFIALRKIQITGSLTIMATIYGLILLFAPMNPILKFTGLLIGAIIGDTLNHFFDAYKSDKQTTIALIIFRFITSIFSLILPTIMGYTKSDVISLYKYAGLGGTVLGALIGGIIGSYIVRELKKAGVL